MASTFVINYLPAGSDPYGVGDTCTTWPDEAKTSFETAVSVWSTRVISSVPITIDACWATNLATGVLGHAASLSAYQNFTNAPLPNTFYKVALANALAGSKLNVGQSDMYIAYSSTFNWYYSADGNTPADKIDFITVVAHEVAHGLGFAGGMTVSSGTGSYSTIYAYDRFAYNGSSQALLNTTIFPNPSTALGTVLTSNNVWFSGTKANIANNNTDVKLYAPTTWASGSSYSHLDYTTFVNTSNAMMVYAVSYGRAIHDPGVVTIGLLEDLGWTTVATPTYTLAVTKNGTGSGSVTSAPAGISCGSTCSNSFTQGTSVTLTAVGDTGSVFSGWSGGGCSGTGTCVVSLANDTTVTASFATATTLFNQTFDAVSAPTLPAGWTSSIVTLDGTWATNAGTVHPTGIAAHSGANLVFFNSFDVYSGYSAALSSPVFSLSGTSNNTASFWMYRDPTEYSDAGVTNDDRVEVYINTANNLTGATLLGTVNRLTTLSPTVATAGWYNYSFAIPGTFAGTTNYLIFKGISGYGNNIHIDDISVLGVPAIQPTLTINLVSTAAGVVNGGGSISGSGISCSSVNGGTKTGTCSASFSSGSTVTLAAAADANSTFTTFSGPAGCTTAGGCSFSITADTTVTGSFAGAYKAKISGGSGYDTLTLAHANAGDNAIILARELHNATTLAVEPFVEDLTVTKPVTLKGGYNAGFSSNSGIYSTLSGILTIGGTTGSLTVENLIIK
ncbi:hypothetical protein FY034_06045 [Trichlorobacter lovleyi]|nr:hypothetical protein FY034_06045 [Trichlorobacter lovleyi]